MYCLVYKNILRMSLVYKSLQFIRHKRFFVSINFLTVNFHTFNFTIYETVL